MTLAIDAPPALRRVSAGRSRRRIVGCGRRQVRVRANRRANAAGYRGLTRGRSSDLGPPRTPIIRPVLIGVTFQICCNRVCLRRRRENERRLAGGSDRRDRRRLDRPAVAGRDLGVLAGPRQLPRSRAGRRHPRRLLRGRAVTPRLRPPRLVAPRRGARSRRRRQGLSRPDLLPGRAPDPGAPPLPLRCPALLCQRRRLPRSRPGTHR